MPNKHLLTAAVVAVVLAAAGSDAAAQDNAQRLLIEQGRYWQQRDATRAAEAWQKLLQTQPGHPDALSGLARLAIESRKFDEARALLARLRQAHPDDPRVTRLDQDIALAGDQQAATLDQARILVREQKANEAISRYREALRGREPQGTLAIEYYSVLGYTANGWREGVTALRRLRTQDPGNSQILMALAGLLIVKAETRVEGIRIFAALARRPDIGGEATEQWRNALTWLGAPPPPQTVALFQEYLQANPDDEGIRSQLRASRTAGGGAAGARPAGTVAVDRFAAQSSAGFAALQDGNLQRAQDSFQAALRLRPGDAAASGGLGLVRLRQENFADARDLLAHASQRGDGARWKQALDSAAYWDDIQRARDARQAGRLEDARALLETASRSEAREATADNLLGSVYADLGRPGDAERVFRGVLAREPANLAALQGLIGVLTAARRGDEALRLVDGLDPGLLDRIDIGRLRAEHSLVEGRDALARGELAAARHHLEDAVVQSPGDPWVRLELARLYLRAGTREEAIGTVDALLANRPDQPAALYVAALVRADLEDWPGALALTERIPAADRTQDMAALRERSWQQDRLAQVRALIQRGELPQARAALGPLAEKAGRDAGLDGAVAVAYADAGDPVRARALLREALAREDRPSPALRLQYAGLLLRLEQDAEFLGVLRQLQAQPLDASERGQYDALQRDYALRQAEVLRRRGELALAYEGLRPLLESAPNDPLVLGALARMYADAGQPGEASQLYQRIVASAPDDLGALQAAGGFAAAAGDLDHAEQLLLRARALAPENPETLAALGRVYRQQGKSSKALPLLRQAEAALQHQLVARAPAHAASAQVRTGAQAIRADNPFAALPSRAGAAR